MTEKILRIKGVADFSSVVAEAKTVTQVLEQTMGKKKIDLFDPKSLDFATKQGKRALEDLGSVLEDLRKEAEGFDQALQDTQKSEQDLGRLVEKRLDNLRKQAEAQKQIIQIKNTGEAPEKPTQLQTVPSQRGRTNGERRFGGRITDALGQAASMAPGGAGQAANVLTTTARGAQQGAGAGGSMLGSIGLGLLGGALAGGVGMLGMGVARSSIGNDAYKQRIPALTQMQAMGTDQVSGVGRSTATSLGYGPGETDALQVGLRRSMGGNLSTEQENNRLASTMNFSRALALDPSEVSGAAGTMRAAGGTDFASTQTARILSDAFRSGMDKSQAATFLATMSQGIAEMSNDGTAATNSLLSFATKLTKGGASPEQALRRFSGVNDAIAGSQGTDNAVFQMAAVRGGLGGGSLLGSQLAVRQGLQDMNLYGKGGVLSQVENPDLQRQAMNAFGGEGGLADKDFTKKMASGVLEQIGAGPGGFDREDKNGFEALISRVMTTFQTKTPGEAVTVIDTLERLAKGTDKKGDRERLKSLSESPQERMNTELISTLKDLKTASVEARAAYASVDLGKQVAPFFNSFTESMTKFDEGLTKMLGTDAGKALGEGITAMLKAPIDLLTGAVNGLTDFMQSIKDLTVGEILIKGVTEMADALWTSLSAVFGLVMDGATEALKPVLAVGKGLMDAGGALMSGNFTGIADAFMGGFKSVNDRDSLGNTKAAFQDKANRDAGGGGVTVNGMSLEEAQRTIPKNRAEAVSAYVNKAEKASPGERAEMARRKTGESDPIKAEELFRQMLQEMKTMNRKMTPGGAVLKPATKPTR